MGDAVGGGGSFTAEVAERRVDEDLRVPELGPLVAVDADEEEEEGGHAVADGVGNRRALATRVEGAGGPEREKAEPGDATAENE